MQDITLETFPANKGGTGWRLLDKDDKILATSWVLPDEDGALSAIEAVKTLLNDLNTANVIYFEKANGLWAWKLMDEYGNRMAYGWGHKNRGQAVSSVAKVAGWMQNGNHTLNKLGKNRILGKPGD